ncbi:MAG: basic amino acid ABC transporter substrate-binding protein, partial [Devosia sp.]|nr:basic amino acid ABC transporter substrate-binding protein [Devosia sp.]
MKPAVHALAATLIAAFAIGSASAAALPDLGGRTIRAVTENAYTPLNFADPKTGQG